MLGFSFNSLNVTVDDYIRDKCFDGRPKVYPYAPLLLGKPASYKATKKKARKAQRKARRNNR